MKRDFTYIDDITEGILRVMQGAPERKTGEDGFPVAPYAVYNIGGGQPENSSDFVSVPQEELVRAGVLPQDYALEAHRELVPIAARRRDDHIRGQLCAGPGFRFHAADWDSGGPREICGMV